MSVHIYTLPNCVQCDMTKKQFNQLGIEYQETRLDQNPAIADQFRDQGLMQAPIVTAGNKIWSGFRLGNIRAIKVNHLEE